MRKKIFLIGIALVFFAGAKAYATPPPNKQESVICEISGKVFLFADIQMKVTQKSNQHSYENPLVSTGEKNDVRIEVESAKYNEKTRFGCKGDGCIGSEYSKAWCESLPGKVTEVIALCQKTPLKLGQEIKAKLQRGYVYGNGYCLDIVQ